MSIVLFVLKWLGFWTLIAYGLYCASRFLEGYSNSFSEFVEDDRRSFYLNLALWPLAAVVWTVVLIVGTLLDPVGKLFFNAGQRLRNFWVNWKTNRFYARQKKKKA